MLKIKPLIFTALFLCSASLFSQEVAKNKANASSSRQNFIMEAKKYVGCPYEYGAVGPDTFDCSGLIYFVAREAIGLQLPRTAKAIYNFSTIIPDKDKQPGDLLFFKTNDTAPITHVGIYIGNEQFISAISDGPNTGVIISSLNQSYWKTRYKACGQIIKAAKKPELLAENSSDTQNSPAAGGADIHVSVAAPSTPEAAISSPAVDSNISSDNSSEKAQISAVQVQKKTSAKAGTKNGVITRKALASDAFLDNLILDASLHFDWSLISPHQFMFRYKGIDFITNARYQGWVLEPGFGFGLRFNSGLGLFQIPLYFSATFNDFCKIYAGPVISFSSGTLNPTGKAVSPSFFPGLIGFEVATPPIEIGKTKLQLVQDVNYTVYNNTDNSALNFVESISAGLVMYTGVKITFPASIFTGA